MAQYLNLAGVEALWGKIKGTFLPKSGGTLTGTTTLFSRYTDTLTVGGTTPLTLTISRGGSWGTPLFNIKNTYNSSTAAGFIGAYGNEGKVNTIYIGFGEEYYDNASFRVTQDALYYKTNTLIHSGNIGSQSVSYASSAGNTTTIRGWDINIYNNKPFGGIPIVANNGVMSIGRYLDFYYTDDMSKYAARIQCQNTTYVDLTLPSSSGTLARLTDNVASATNASQLNGFSINDICNKSGENIIVGSSTASIVSNWSTTGWDGYITTYDTENGIYEMYSYNGWRTHVYEIPSEYLNTTLSYSFDVYYDSEKSTQAITGEAGITSAKGYGADIFAFGADILTKPNTWVHYSGNFIPTNTNKYFGFFLRCTDSSSKSTYIRVKNLKIEKGNLSSIWTPSVKDIGFYDFSNNGNFTKLNIGGVTKELTINYANTADSAVYATYASRLGDSNAYYTKSSLDTSLNGKSNTDHTHTSFANSITVTGSVSASSGFYQSSDERLKTFHDPIKVDLEKLKLLKKNYFKFNDKDKLDIGVSAQEIQEIYPELVTSDDNGYLSVAYDKLSVIALSAIDELHEENKQLKSENDELRSRIEAIENILNKLIINQ